ncbi:MAG: hypothetical protein SFX73_24500 [Kofleriaceae bacterium]|nr:hypothetical protein [Kofleriaceae bacterium]
MLIIATSGCSFALEGPPRIQSRTKAPECSDSKGTVVLDGLVAAVAGVAGLVALDEGAEEAGAFLTGTALLYTIAAVRGNSVVNRCRQAQDQFAMEEQGDEGQAEATPPQPPQFQPRVPPPAMADVALPVAAVEPTPAPSTPTPSTPPPPTVTAPPTPRPAPTSTAKPAAPPPAAPARPAAPAPAADDDWSAFWEEVQ